MIISIYLVTCISGAYQHQKYIHTLTQEELGMRVEAPQERALWEATWRLRPYYPRSNIIGRLPNCVAITGTLVTPIVGYLGDVSSFSVRVFEICKKCVFVQFHNFVHAMP
jgi:hypothetical protein